MKVKETNQQEIFIPGKLPGLNEMISMAKVKIGRGTLYDFKKKDLTSKIARKLKKLDKMEKVVVKLTWIEENRRRDPDNVIAGKKYILDALVKAGIIKNDTHRHIAGFQEQVVYGENPGVWVILEEIK